MSVPFEKQVVNGVELYHTCRGHNNEVEVYTYQAGPKTYSLFKKKDDRAWRCDWMTAHSWEEIDLDADPTDVEAMLEALAGMLKSQR